MQRKILKKLFYFGLAICFFSLISIFGYQSYSAYEKAYNEWSYNWLYIKTFTWWETHVFSVPSLIINDNFDHEIILNDVSTFFSIDWTTSLPWKYYDKSETSESFEFVPKLLYKWKNCWVQTDQEIVNFIFNLRDSYNREPFKSNPYYKEIFDDYDFLMNGNLNNFEALKKLWRKINKWLKCDLDNFKTSVVFPVSCWDQDGTFEHINDLTDINNTCLFSYNWSWDAIVKENVWSWATKWLHISWLWYNWLSKLKYKIFSYKPIKISFDYKAIFWLWWGYSPKFEFFIDGQKFINKNNSSPWLNNYSHFESPLLPPWLHEFEWYTFRNLNTQTELFLDNILLSCVWWGVWCWWTDFESTGPTSSQNSLEKWDVDPFDIFTFWWDFSIPWLQISWAWNVSDWTYAIKSPVVDWKKTFILYKKTLDKPAKISFDIKNAWAWIYWDTKFLINGIVDLKYWAWFSTWFDHYESSLLPPWDYEFKWYTESPLYNIRHIVLDNIKFTCINWGTWCWISNFDSVSASSLVNSIEVWEKNPWEVFTFSWTSNLPWRLVSWPWNVSTIWWSTSTYSLSSYFPSINGDKELVLEKELTLPWKIEFDIKNHFNSYDKSEFYINDILFKSWYNWSDSESDFVHYSSELLPAWIYKFRWISKPDSWFNDSYMLLDNIKFTCINWWAWCWWSDFNLSWNKSVNPLEIWAKEPWGLFSFSWVPSYFWTMVTWTWNVNWPSNSHAIKIAETDFLWDRNLILTKTLYNKQKLKFDFKTDITTYDNYFVFYINWVEYLKIDRYSSSYDLNYHTFTTPLLKPWNYTFTWKSHYHNNDYWIKSKLWLDNIEFVCINWWAWCWRSDFSPSWPTSEINPLEHWTKSPWDLFIFSWAVSTPWNIVTWTWNVNWPSNSYALKADYPNMVWNMDMVLKRTLNDPQKLSFDFKTDIYWTDWFVAFYINWVDYLKLTRYSSSNDRNYHTFTTPLLPPWNYTFTWRLYRPLIVLLWREKLWLDNIEFSCINWWAWCWLSDFSSSWPTSEINPLEHWPKNPWEVFTFGWVVSTPWPMVTWPWNVNWPGSSYALKANFWDTKWTKELVLERDLSGNPQKLSFDFKTRLTWSAYVTNVAFYINWVEYLKVTSYSGVNDWNYHTFTTPLLPPWNYTFKWTLSKSYLWNRSELWLDNIKFSCIWWGWTCWIKGDYSLDEWPENPWEVFTFSWDLTLPWKQVTWPWNIAWSSEDYTYSLKVDHDNITWDRDLVLNKELTSSQKIKFKVKTLFSPGRYSKFYFYINWVLKKTISSSTSGFISYESELLPAWNYEFKFRSRKSHLRYRSFVWIDNIEFWN